MNYLTPHNLLLATCAACCLLLACLFACLLTTQRPPKSAPRRAKEHPRAPKRPPRAPQETPKSDPRNPLDRKSRPRRPLGAISHSALCCFSGKTRARIKVPVCLKLLATVQGECKESARRVQGELILAPRPLGRASRASN
jgi:hypothetical protein